MQGGNLKIEKNKCSLDGCIAIRYLLISERKGASYMHSYKCVYLLLYIYHLLKSVHTCRIYYWNVFGECMLSSSVVSHSLQLYGHKDAPARLLCPWDFQGKNTGVDYHFLLQGIFLTQGPNPHLFCLPHRQVGSSPLVPPGKPNSSEDLNSILRCSRISYMDLFLGRAP